MNKTNSIKVVLATLPENLRVSSHTQDDEFTSKWLRHEQNGLLTFKFGKKDFVANLNIPLNDGSLLTDKKNKEIYSLVKRWIHEQHFPRTRKLAHMKSSTAKSRLWAVLRVIDKFFLNSVPLSIYPHGFSQVTPGVINQMLIEFIQSNNSHDSIYSWPKRLSNFLKEKIMCSSQDDFMEFTKENPIFLEPIPKCIKRELSLTDDEIFQSRVWLYKNNYYEQRDEELWPGHIKTTVLVKELYPHCIMAQHMRPVSLELEIQAICGYRREYPQIPVRRESESATHLRYNKFRGVLLSQKNLPHSAIKIPSVSLNELTNNDQKDDLAIIGSYLTLPHFMTIETLRKSVLFFEENADSIFNFCAEILRSAWAENITPQAYYQKYIFPQSTPGERFSCWNLCVPSRTAYTAGATSESLNKMRRMEGVLQSYYALMGSIQYTVGFLSARRQSELLKIRFSDICNDNNYISTLVMKTGIGENRLRFELPVVPLIMKMLSRIKQFLTDCGIPPEVIQGSYCFGRFSLRRKPGVNNPATKYYNSHLDVACDLFETDVVDGSRFYVRQHQLRRAFAIGFFYLNERGSLSVLSYYFGHMDFKQIYRYITTVIGNKEMLDIKASYLAQKTVDNAPDITGLMAKLGADESTTIRVLEHDRLEHYYRTKLQEGALDVEPQFLSTSNAHQILISITIRDRDNGK